TLHGWWSGHDIDLWERLGFYPRSEAGPSEVGGPDMATLARTERAEARERLLRALRREKLWPEGPGGVPGYSPALSQAVHAYLASSQSALVTVQLEDMA